MAFLTPWQPWSVGCTLWVRKGGGATPTAGSYCLVSDLEERYEHASSEWSSAAVAQLGAGSSSFSIQGTSGTLVLLRLQSAVQLGSQSPKPYPEPSHSAPCDFTGTSDELFPV